MACNRGLKARIHKIDFDSVLKLQDIFGSAMSFSFHLRAAKKLLSYYSVEGSFKTTSNEKCSFTTQRLEFGCRGQRQGPHSMISAPGRAAVLLLVAD